MLRLVSGLVSLASVLLVFWTLLYGVSSRNNRFSAPDDEDLDPFSQVVCEESDYGYIIPDPDQCDRFAECSPTGKLSVHLCEDGFGLDQNNGDCDLLYKVDCSGREKLQEPTGSGMCPRLNGNFPVPAEMSCSDYVDCREGQPFHQTCGYGAVFDPILGCVHPDQTTREGCTATDVLGFKCPRPTGDQRFGDQQRLPHPTDCAYFYVCLSTGLPRLLGCERPKVFNPKSGLCDKPENVPGCEDYYPAEKQSLEDERVELEAKIRKELEIKYGIRTDDDSEAEARRFVPPQLIEKYVPKQQQQLQQQQQQQQQQRFSRGLVGEDEDIAGGRIGTANRGGSGNRVGSGGLGGAGNRGGPVKFEFGLRPDSRSRADFL